MYESIGRQSSVQSCRNLISLRTVPFFIKDNVFILIVKEFMLIVVHFTALGTSLRDEMVPMQLERFKGGEVLLERSLLDDGKVAASTGASQRSVKANK